MCCCLILSLTCVYGKSLSYIDTRFSCDIELGVFVDRSLTVLIARPKYMTFISGLVTFISFNVQLSENIIME